MPPGLTVNSQTCQKHLVGNYVSSLVLPTADVDWLVHQLAVFDKPRTKRSSWWNFGSLWRHCSVSMTLSVPQTAIGCQCLFFNKFTTFSVWWPLLLQWFLSYIQRAKFNSFYVVLSLFFFVFLKEAFLVALDRWRSCCHTWVPTETQSRKKKREMWPS